MHQLIKFLSNEMPDYIDDFISVLTATVESIENIRDAITDIIPTLWNQKERRKDINTFDAMDKELENIKNYINLYLVEMDSSILSEIAEKLDEIIEEESEMDNVVNTEKTDYSKYLVDKTIPYKLLDDFKNTSPYAFTFEGIQYLVDSWYEVTIKICEILYKKDEDLFNKIVGNCEIKGRKNVYIAFENDYPARTIGVKRQLLNTNIVIEQRLSANQHMIVVKRLLDKYKISRTAIEIFLESDRKPLHGQQPIGKYINKKVNEVINSEIIEVKNDIKIGAYAKEYFTYYFSDTTHEYELENFLNKYWCIDNLGICYPLLKEVDMAIPISKQKGYNNEYSRYWTKPVLEINGKYYILCSQWFARFREKLDKWINKNEKYIIKNIPKMCEKTNCVHYDFKKDICYNLNNPLFNQPCISATSCKYFSEQVVYITPKEEMKNNLCPCCETKSQIIKMQVTYTKNGISTLATIHYLDVLQCENCNKTFININVFETYTKSKNLEDINIKFIELKK